MYKKNVGTPRRAFNKSRPSSSPSNSSGYKPSSNSNQSNYKYKSDSRTRSDNSSSHRDFNSNYRSRFGNNSRSSYRGGGSYNRSRFQRGPRERDFSRYISKVDHTIDTKEEIYVSSIKFSDLNLNSVLLKNIIDRGYVSPTKIQDQVIPNVLQNKDVLALANTGSGKTAAFLIPLLNKMITNPEEKCLVVAPTRELVKQITQELRIFSKNSNIRDAVLIGGASVRDQIIMLRRRPRFVIATPGRLIDLSNRNLINLSEFNNVVLDEVDQMLDMGFVEDIKLIISKLKNKKQSMFFSATLDKQAENIANSLLVNPVTIKLISKDVSKNVEQNVVKVKKGSSKVDVLHDLLLDKTFEKVIIFSKTKQNADSLSMELQRRGFNSAALHGDKPLSARTRILASFREGHVSILIATDVASRGIDIPDITHVINFDEPQNYADYTHRIGRTGRIGKKGFALTFVEVDF